MQRLMDEITFMHVFYFSSGIANFDKVAYISCNVEIIFKTSILLSTIDFGKALFPYFVLSFKFSHILLFMDNFILFPIFLR